MGQGGEFGFVLFTVSTVGGLIEANLASLMTAVVTVTMVLTPTTRARRVVGVTAIRFVMPGR